MSLAAAAVAAADAPHSLVTDRTEAHAPRRALLAEKSSRAGERGDEPLSARDLRVRRALVGDALAAKRALLSSSSRDPSHAEPASLLSRDRTQPRASSLGIPSAPAVPVRRRRFRMAPDDPAREAAGSIARRVSRFYNFRAVVPGAVWHEDQAARFAIRGQRACLAELARLRIHTALVSHPLATPVPAPVVIDAPIDGVRFASLHADREVVVSCELAVRLRALAATLRDHGVLAVGVNSSYRDHPKVSFHTFGLALDLATFRMRDRTLMVAKHFEVTPDAHTCEATPATPEGKALLAIVCAIADSHRFSTVLTPNYNEGHRDHFHLDIRPDDPRLFVR